MIVWVRQLKNWPCTNFLPLPFLMGGFMHPTTGRTTWKGKRRKQRHASWFCCKDARKSPNWAKNLNLLLHPFRLTFLPPPLQGSSHHIPEGRITQNSVANRQPEAQRNFPSKRARFIILQVLLVVQNFAWQTEKKPLIKKRGNQQQINSNFCMSNGNWNMADLWVVVFGCKISQLAALMQKDAQASKQGGRRREAASGIILTRWCLQGNEIRREKWVT